MTICNVLPNVSSVTVTDDSVMNVNSGGTAIDTILNTAGVTSSNGTETSYGNLQYVYFGGTTTGTTVNSGGEEVIGS